MVRKGRSNRGVAVAGVVVIEQILVVVSRKHAWVVISWLEAARQRGYGGGVTFGT